MSSISGTCQSESQQLFEKGIQESQQQDKIENKQAFERSLNEVSAQDRLGSGETGDSKGVKILSEPLKGLNIDLYA